MNTTALIFVRDICRKHLKEMVVDATYCNLGIFKKKDVTVYYNNNELKYQSKDITKASSFLPQRTPAQV